VAYFTVGTVIDNGPYKHNFPESIELHRVLGRAYEKMGANEQAIETYLKMVLMAKQQNDPRLDDYQNQLERVKKKQ
jgi:hypothetical protein